MVPCRRRGDSARSFLAGCSPRDRTVAERTEPAGGPHAGISRQRLPGKNHAGTDRTESRLVRQLRLMRSFGAETAIRSRSIEADTAERSIITFPSPTKWIK